jgi:hypothetical protein
MLARVITGSSLHQEAPLWAQLDCYIGQSAYRCFDLQQTWDYQPKFDPSLHR